MNSKPNRPYTSFSTLLAGLAYLLGLLFLIHSPLSLSAKPLKVPCNEIYKDYPDLRDHPGHYPFISYLTFRNVCDHIIDTQTETFDPEDVQIGDTIYLATWYLYWFNANVHDKILHPYILVTASEGGWDPPPALYKMIYDPKLAAWFCRNNVFSHHPKLIQIPMGQDLALFDTNPLIIQQLDDTVASLPVPKTHLLYMNIFPRPHGDRDKIVKIFEDKPYCFTRNHSSRPWIFTPREEFYQDVAASKYTLSPLGLETDCVRTWEAFVLNSIPIVEHTFLDPLYEGLPVLMVKDWSEINEPYLHEQYDLLKDLSLEKAYFDYWKALLDETQAKIRDGDLSFTYPDATQFSAQDLSDLAMVVQQYVPKSFRLFYRGFCSTVRPFQLLGALKNKQKKLCLADPWLKPGMKKALLNYLGNKDLMSNVQRVLPFANDEEFKKALGSAGPVFLFLDLTYYRTSLYINFSSSGIQYGNFRQSLKNDLALTYKLLPQGSILCGNGEEDPYVRKILIEFANQYNLQIRHNGAFWFVIIGSSLSG